MFFGYFSENSKVLVLLSLGLFPHKLTSLFETLEEPWSLTSSLWLAVEETKERKRLSAKSVSRSFCSTFPGSVCHGTQLILPPPPPAPNHMPLTDLLGTSVCSTKV